jgi:hypothetical protein
VDSPTFVDSRLMGYVSIKLTTGEIVMLEGQKIEDVITALQSDSGYVRLETPNGVHYVNPQHVVSINTAG